MNPELPVACEAWVAGNAASRLHDEYQSGWSLFSAQPDPIRFFLNSQAQILADVLLHRQYRSRFFLPSWVVCHPGSDDPQALPGRAREHEIGGRIESVLGRDRSERVRKCLSRLERDSNQAVSAGARLLRFATAIHIVHGVLPPINSLASKPEAKDLDPVLLSNGDLQPGYTIVGDLPVPVLSFIRIFQEVKLLAPYIVLDKQYQQKRSLLLGRWIEQNRELARYQTLEIIKALHRREGSLSLHRGLRLSLPYFDDVNLELKLYELSVVPACRIGFEAVFVAAAALRERGRLLQDQRFSPTTRNHLLAQLRLLEASFRPDSPVISMKD